MNRYFEKNINGFVIAYKKSKFQIGEITIFDQHNMASSIYEATIFPMKEWDSWLRHVDNENKINENNFLTMEKISKKIIIETENMLN
jgi:hypothetical protein